MPRYESPYDPSTMPIDLEHVISQLGGHSIILANWV